MLESPVRVALLARPGEARDQLRRALAELGAQMVAEGDPAELDPGIVAGEKPSVVLVSLEPAMEDALARFDELLGAPGIEVMYDDAEVTRSLDGWDLARWARHLAAKLVGSDLLPPAPGDSDQLPEFDLSLEPGAPPTPAQEMENEKLEDYAAESLDLSDWVPSTPSLASEPVPESEPVEPAPAVADEVSLDLDLGDLEQAMGRLQADIPEAPEAGTTLELASEESLEFDASTLDIDLSALPEEGSRLTSAADELSLVDNDEPLLVDLELPSEPVKFSSYTDEEAPLGEHMDDDVAALAAQLDAFEAQDHRKDASEPDFLAVSASPRAEEAPEPAPAAAPAAAPSFGSSFGSLELMPMDAEVSAPAPVAEPPPLMPAALSTKRTATISLADAEATDNNATARGALLVLAGLGGPDAVRQLLAVLPPTLPVPVLLYQHLDTGKHDRLVGQLAKASGLPLNLAVEGKLAFPGRVAVLQPGIGVHFSDDSFTFTRVDQLASVVAALPAADSAVLVLSGADPAVLPAVLALQSQGAFILAQDPTLCFDAVSATAVIEAGAIAASPSELARLVIERWK